MARKRSSRREEPRQFEERERDEETAARRVASWVTFFLVSLITVVLGYALGRYAIVNLLTDSLGLETPTPGTTQIQTIRTGSATATGAVSATQGSLPAGTTGRNEESGTAPAQAQPPAASQGSSVPGAGSGGSSAQAASGSTAPAGTFVPATGSQGSSTSRATLYRVQVGGFATRDGADQLLAALKPTFPDAFVTFNNEYRVQVGAYSTAAGAEEVASNLRAMGYTTVHVIAAP